MEQDPLLCAMIMAHLRDDCEEDELVEVLRSMAGPEEVFSHVSFLKGKGNDLFRRGDFELAHQNYEMAAKLLSCSLPACNESLFRDLALSLNLNLAACALISMNFERARALCSLVINFDSKNVKARYRRALANMELGLFVESRWDLEKILEVEPSNKECLKELEKVKIRIEAKRKRPQDKMSGTSQERKGKKIMVEDEEVSSQLVVPSIGSKELGCVESYSCSNAQVECLDVVMDGGNQEGDKSSQDVISCVSCDSCGDATSKVEHEVDASRYARLKTTKPKLRFFNQRKRGTSLDLPESVYALISQGKEATFFHPKLGSIMKIRSCKRAPVVSPSVFGSNFLEVSMDPSESCVTEERCPAIISPSPSPKFNPLGEDMCVEDLQETRCEVSFGSECSSNDPLCDTDIETEVSSEKMVWLQFNSKSKARARIPKGRAIHKLPHCKDHYLIHRRQGSQGEKLMFIRV